MSLTRKGNVGHALSDLNDLPELPKLTGAKISDLEASLSGLSEWWVQVREVLKRHDFNLTRRIEELEQRNPQP